MLRERRNMTEETKRMAIIGAYLLAAFMTICASIAGCEATVECEAIKAGLSKGSVPGVSGAHWIKPTDKVSP